MAPTLDSLKAVAPATRPDPWLGGSMDNAALEALERLALDFAAVEAERLSALGCAEHSGRLLGESREATSPSASPLAIAPTGVPGEGRRMHFHHSTEAKASG